jgi:hypothetical protein
VCWGEEWSIIAGGNRVRKSWFHPQVSLGHNKYDYHDWRSLIVAAFYYEEHIMPVCTRLNMARRASCDAEALGRRPGTSSDTLRNGR